MKPNDSIQQIRENEKVSHTQIYSSAELFEGGSWLRKPIRTVLDLFSHFETASRLRVLDLGCGVGRNCIPLAIRFQHIPCIVECVDILDFAIEKLNANACRYHVSDQIKGIVSPLEAYPIAPNTYDLILAVSALEHIDSVDSFRAKLREAERGIRKNGIVCFVINSQVTEEDPRTGAPLPPQFEVNLPTQELITLLRAEFCGWEELKVTVSCQEYEIPRGSVTSHLHSQVVTFVAKKSFLRSALPPSSGCSWNDG